MMPKSGASKGAKKIKPFDEQNTKLAMGKIIKIPRVSIKEQIQSGKDLDYKADRKKHADYYKMMETEFFDD